MVKRGLAALLLILLLLTAPGCWNLRDPELLAIVLATAFDYDEERELYLIIVQIANPQAMQAQEGGSNSGSQNPVWVISAYGHTPFEAMRNLGVGSSREMFWAHNRLLLISEKMARRGIAEIMDLFERERQLRVIARPGIVQGDIRALMEANYPLEETGARGIDRQMVTIQYDQSVFHAKFLNELYSIFEAPGQEVIIGKLEVQSDKKGEESDNEGSNGEGGNNSGGSNPPAPAQLMGGALFKQDRMVGWATSDQMEGWLLAMGRGRRYNYVMECPGCPEHYFSAEIFNVAATREIVNSDGKLQGIINVGATSRIQNYQCQGNLNTESEFIRSLERRTAEAIRRNIMDAVQISQELQTDVLGFGNLIFRKRPRLWEEIKEDWDDLFRALPVEVNVQISIMRTGLIRDPMVIQ